MMRNTTRRRLLQCVLTLLAALVGLGFPSGPAQAQQPLLPSFKRLHTDLYNFDLRVPQMSAPLFINDVVIIVYGFFPNGAQDVVNLFPNPLWPVQPPIYTHNARDIDPHHPGYGMDRLEIRYGPGAIAQPGTLMHFGVHLRPCRLHVHIEAWWTMNGQRVARAWLCHLHKIRVPGGWLVRVGNPRVWSSNPESDRNLYLYGARYFQPSTGKLPRLPDLLRTINPANFGSSGWTDLQDGTRYPEIAELAPDGVTTFFVPVDSDTEPPVVQLFLRLTPPPSPRPSPAEDPDTVSIGMDRAAVELTADLTGEGAVGIPAFNVLRSQFGQASPDENP